MSVYRFVSPDDFAGLEPDDALVPVYVRLSAYQVARRPSYRAGRRVHLSNGAAVLCGLTAEGAAEYGSAKICRRCAAYALFRRLFRAAAAEVLAEGGGPSVGLSDVDVESSWAVAYYRRCRARQVPPDGNTGA